MALRQRRLTAFKLARRVVGLLVLSTATAARAGVPDACAEQATLAEAAAGIPSGLLLAIGKRESGRMDPRTGAILPWPWSVNRDGEGRIFETREEAVAFVADAQRAGSRSIDVGCFQINLKYHPAAFASLDAAFDPAANAAYAARFLSALRDRDGSWEAAVADYHSATAWLGAPYRDAVLAIWHGLSPSAEPVAFPAMKPTRVLMGIRIYEPDIGPDSAGVPTVQTGQARAPAHGGGKLVSMASLRHLDGLPRVYTLDGALTAH